VAASCEQTRANWTLSIRQPIFDDMTANEQTSVSRVADREKLSLLLDKARQFAGKDCRTATSILGQTRAKNFL